MRPLKRHRRVAESLSAFTAEQAQRKQLGSLPTRKPTFEYVLVPVRPAKPPQVPSKVQPERRQEPQKHTAIVDLCSPPACKRSRKAKTLVPPTTSTSTFGLAVSHNSITTLAEHVCKLRRQAADLSGPLYLGSFCTFDVVCRTDNKSIIFMVLDGTNTSVAGVNVELIGLVDIHGTRHVCSAHDLEKVCVLMSE